MKNARAQCEKISGVRDSSIEWESRVARLLHLEFDSVCALLDSSQKSVSGLADLRAETDVKVKEDVDVQVSEILELGRSVAAFTESQGSALRDASVFDLQGEDRNRREHGLASLKPKVIRLRVAARQLANELHVNAQGFALDRQGLVYAIESRDEVQTRLRLAKGQIEELEKRLGELREAADKHAGQCVEHFEGMRGLLRASIADGGRGDSFGDGVGAHGGEKGRSHRRCKSILSRCLSHPRHSKLRDR